MISRQTISDTYITGTGIEIGAHHNPFPVRSGVKVIYVDKRTKKELIEGFPEIKNHEDIPETDLIDDGQTLSQVKTEAFDFVLSSHQLEHCSSPLTALFHHVRVLKPGGILFYAIPDHKNPIDQKRKISTLKCLIEDAALYEVDQEYFKKKLIQHYHEYLENVDGIHDHEQRARIAEECILHHRDIHFHCWNSQALIELFHHSQSVLNYQVELFYKINHEYFVVLRKL